MLQATCLLDEGVSWWVDTTIYINISSHYSLHILRRCLQYQFVTPHIKMTMRDKKFTRKRKRKRRVALEGITKCMLVALEGMCKYFLLYVQDVNKNESFHIKTFYNSYQIKLVLQLVSDQTYLVICSAKYLLKSSLTIFLVMKVVCTTTSIQDPYSLLWVLCIIHYQSKFQIFHSNAI